MALMRLKYLLLLSFFIGLQGCQTTQQDTQQEQQARPEIFSHFKPDLSLQTQPTEQPVATADKTAEPVKLQPYKDTPLAKPRAADLWQHIANNLSLVFQTNKHTTARIKWYLKQPAYLEKVNRRAAPYLYHIVKRVEKQNLPMELALLPFVESDFRPTIQSSEQAVGIWQLVGATAYHFGVQSDQWYDGRQDILASTDAALAYLSYLHKRFDGDWLHAIAAYNSGEGRVKKAIEKNKKLGKKADYWSLSLPKETAEYIPKLLALSHLIRHPEKGLKRPKLANKPLTTEFNVGQQFDFSVIASLSGIGRSQLHKLNPGYLKNQSSPNGPHTLILPIEQRTLLQSKLFRNNFIGEYTVQKDDTLYRIARRFNMPISQLKMLNNKTSNLIKVGEQLRLSKPQTMPGSLIVDYNISPYLEQQEDVVSTVAVDYQVKPGDSIWSISQLFDVPHKDVAIWNKLSASSLLKPGTILTLHIPQAKPPAPQTSASEAMLSGIESSLKKP
ncbi:transglycosylase SLT domain-containing protein [Pseudoalteromonas sp. MB41]|uniref:transglycosylase SLT domain-containing protein n=1 Tax=Pseudoalteromonas sp. MB41 TaxID=2896366 RepID=UPI001E2D04B4|nr:transglycosylase SLT domain-containing protein [Pseudoalteromonas sp. MB41]MCC9661726.1 transglycosylase SLT domain-containing protein [Pseudoalteromonas sp. MB41]